MAKTPQSGGLPVEFAMLNDKHLPALGQAEKVVRSGHVVPRPEEFLALRGLPDEHISSLVTSDNIEAPPTRLNPVNSVFLADFPPAPVGVLSADMRNGLVPTLLFCLPDAENLNTLRHKTPALYDGV
ncbi:hypothetical protein QFZ89_008272 [Paraburkholderia youngii]